MSNALEPDNPELVAWLIAHSTDRGLGLLVKHFENGMSKITKSIMCRHTEATGSVDQYDKGRCAGLDMACSEIRRLIDKQGTGTT